MNDKKLPPAFVIDPAPTIEWPVTVRLPEDGGEIAEFQFTGIFNRLSEVELDELLGADSQQQTTAGQEQEKKRTQAVLRENAELFPKLLLGWKGVRDAAGNEAPFGIGQLQAQVIGQNGLFLSAGIWRAVHEIRNGARLGN